MEILCMVTPSGLVPMYDSDYDEKRRLREGDTVLCTIRRPRNYEFHKKFFALMRLTYDNLPERLERMLNIRSIDDLILCVKLDLGLVTTAWHEGREFVLPQSISFASMDETEFQAFYNRCIDLILGTYLRGLSKKALTAEIEHFM